MAPHKTPALSRTSQLRRFPLRAAGVALCASLLALAPAVAIAAPAGAASGFAVASGFASYMPGGGSTTPAPVQFDTLTLASGGTAAASTLSVTGQPASGTATASTSTGIITYSPTSATSGNQTVTFQLCEAGPTDCQTATLTEGAGIAVNNAFEVPLLGGYAAYDVGGYGALAPSSAVQGTTFTVDFAPVSITIPSSLSLGSVGSATINYVDVLDYVFPVPANATYVSASLVGGDANTDGSGASIAYCTSPPSGASGACSAQASSSSFPSETTAPYLEVQLASGKEIDGGTTITMPTVSAQFKASGSIGSTIQPEPTEFDVGASVTITGIGQESATLDTYPVAPGYSSGSAAPAAYAYPLSTTDVVSVPAAPSISSFSPTSGPQAGGTQVTISGSNLESASSVEFGSTPATITGDTSTSLVVDSPAGTGNVTLSVTTPGGSATSTSDFDYLAPPTISGISPASGSELGGTQVTISGSNLSNATVVDFGTTAGTITSDSASSIGVTAPAGSVGTVPVSVTTPGGTATDPDAFTYQAPPSPPTISAISPTTGTDTTTVTLTGTNLENADDVDFGSLAGHVDSDTPTQITVTPPNTTGTVSVYVTTGGGTATAPEQFTFQVQAGVPAVSGISVTSGPSWGGTSVTVTGTGFSGASAVYFGSELAFFQDVTSTSLVATAPAGSGTVYVTVTNSAGTSPEVAASEFTYTTPAPTVGTVSPTSGPSSGGTLVTVSGTGLSDATGVDFGTVPGVIVGWGTSSLSVLSPAVPALGAVNVTVTSAGGTSTTSAADKFTYSAPAAPAVTGVSPSEGPAGGGTVVTVTGAGLSSVTAVDFGSQTALFYDVSDTSLTAVAPAGSGVVDVTVTTAGGTSSTGAADQFTYDAAPPAVTGISPSSGPATGGTVVTVTGSNLLLAVAVDFGSTAGIVTADSPTSVTVLAPAGSGSVDVTVTTPEGTSPTVAGDHFTYTATSESKPAVTHVSPAAGPTSGGTVVKIKGRNLRSVKAVRFGKVKARFSHVTGNSLEVVAPAGKTGTVRIVVTTAKGTSASVKAAEFTYRAHRASSLRAGGARTYLV